MTIALDITLKEDWGRNSPAVVVKSKSLHGEYIIGVLTPTSPKLSVTLTSLNDLTLEPSGVEPYSAAFKRP